MRHDLSLKPIFAADTSGRYACSDGKDYEVVTHEAAISTASLSRQSAGRCFAVRGFTLVEAALVLLIVSVMLATIVSAQSLIVDGRTKQFMRDIESNRFAYLVYTDRYRALPGDDDHAEERWSGARNGNGDGRLGGTYRDSVPAASQLQVDADSGETINYWWHMRLAGLIPNSEVMTDLPQNLFGGTSGVQQSGYGMQGPVLCYENVPAEIAAAVDRQIDDGEPDAGALRGQYHSRRFAAAAL